MKETMSEKVAVMGQNIKDIQSDILDIKTDLKEIKTTLIALPLQNHEDRLKRLEKSSNLWKFLSPTLASVMGALLLFLIMFYLENL